MTDSSIVVMAVAACASVAIIVRSSVEGVSRIVTNKRKPVTEGETSSDARLARLEIAVDSIAVEIERISEGQRFTTRLLNSQLDRPTPRLERPDKFDTPH